MNTSTTIDFIFILFFHTRPHNFANIWLKSILLFASWELTIESRERWLILLDIQWDKQTTAKPPPANNLIAIHSQIVSVLAERHLKSIKCHRREQKAISIHQIIPSATQTSRRRTERQLAKNVQAAENSKRGEYCANPRLNLHSFREYRQTYWSEVLRRKSDTSTNKQRRCRHSSSFSHGKLTELFSIDLLLTCSARKATNWKPNSRVPRSIN